MNKNKLRVVIGLMAVATLGIILIQVYWITKAIEVKKAAFSRHVNDALHNLVENIERKDAFAFVSRSSGLDTMLLPDVEVRTLTPGALKPYLWSDLHRLRDHSIFGQDERPMCERFTKADYLEELQKLHYTPEFTSASAQRDISPDEVNKVLKKNYLLQKLAVDMCRRGIPLEKRLNFGQLDTMLRQSLGEQCIRLDFDYGIRQKAEGPFVFASNKDELGELEQSAYRAQLFPNDFFLEPNYLTVTFPGQTYYVIKRIAGILLGSLVFITIIIFSFWWMMRGFLEQKKLSEMKTDFINNMTHEFKTPVTTIALAAEALRDPGVVKDEKRLNRFAGLIADENKRLERQVERVLQLARMERSELQLHRELLDMDEIISQAIQNISLMLEQRNGKITYSPDATHTLVSGDAVHLENIVYNLLDNAIKYSRLAPEIHIRTFNEKGRIAVQVSDNGIGMSQAEQARVFERFYRVPTGNVHNVKGTGLGLSYVKLVLDAHGGGITVKSNPGKGSAFIFYLPTDK